MNIKLIFEAGKKVIVKNAPSILTGVGIAGFFGAIGLAIKETPRANKALEDLKEQKPDANALDKAKVVIPVYWPMATAAALATAAVIFANQMNLKRYATMLALYKLSEDNKDKIETSMRKILGDSKTEEVKDTAAKEILRESPLSDTSIIPTGKGNTRFMDGLTRQRFTSSPQAVGEAFNRLNFNLMHEDSVCVNELLDELGILPMDPKYVLGVDVGGSSLGDRIGWRMDKYGNLINHKITYVNDDDGEPIGIISYDLGDNPILYYD